MPCGYIGKDRVKKCKMRKYRIIYGEYYMEMKL